MTGVESQEQYIIKDDSSGISKVEPRIIFVLTFILEVFCFRSGCMNIFFSSSSSLKIDEDYFQDADYISEKLAEGNRLITGCCMTEGMSGKILNNFKKFKSKIDLETLKIYNEDPKEFPYVTFNYYANTFERTKSIYEKSDVLIILPGGTGTLAELFSFLEEARTQPNDKKIILYNKNNYFLEIIMLISRFIKENFNDEDIFNYLCVFNNRDELISYVLKKGDE